VGGIAGRFNLVLEEKASPFISLNMPIPIQYTVIEGKDVGERGRQGSMVRLSKNGAEMTLVAPVEPMTDLKMNLLEVDEKLTTKDFYGKVMEQSGDKDDTAMVRFTSIPPEIDAYFEAHRQYTLSSPS
jgi:adenylate cyclase